MASTDAMVDLLEELGRDVPDALVRIVKRSAVEDPEAIRRACEVMRLAAAGVPEASPEYLAAMDALERWTTLMAMRADLATRAEVQAFIGRLLMAVPEVVRIVAAATA